MIVRIVLWSLADAKASYEELEQKLAPLPAPSVWLWNEVNERFGALVHDVDEAVDALAEARALIGKEPELYEEFDAL